MAAFGAGINRPLPGRGGSPGFRFTLYAILSIVLMFLDQRGDWLGKARYFLNAAAYPLQLAVNSPAAAWRWVEESFETRAALQKENERLRKEQRELALKTMRYEELIRENAQLRGLKQALPPVAERWLIAEVISVDPSNLRQRIVINRGTRNGVFEGQAVLDNHGVLGQTVRVGPWSAEIILITDPEHAIPVQIARNGLRTIAVGSAGARVGTHHLALPYLSANADVKVGDVLVTSGLGGVFPQGYPVARVTEVSRSAVQPESQVRASPLAALDRDREVILVWFREDHPAAPAADSGKGEVGNPAFQPRPVMPVSSTAQQAPNTQRPAASPPGSGSAAAPPDAAAQAPANTEAPAGGDTANPQPETPSEDEEEQE